MTSFVVCSSDNKKREEYIKIFCEDQNIDKFDVTVIGKDTSVKTVNSIGIDEIKNLHTKIFLKPIKSDVKAIILEDAHLLTIEAQNALLKVLEEPPTKTFIILSSDSKEAFLPTILSRCQLIELTPENISFSEIEKKEFEEFINNLPEMRIGERLKKAEELAKDKEEAVEWIRRVILVLREKMIEKNSNRKFESSQVKSFQELYTLLKTTNVNPRFAIENTLLKIAS